MESLVSVVGSLADVGIVLTLLLLIRQTRAGERATTAAVYQSIVGLGDSINEMILNDPELYGEIFLSPVDPKMTIEELQASDPRRFFAALRWLDYFETVFVLRSAVPEDMQGVWQRYIRNHIARSSLLKQILLKAEWYSPELRQIAREFARVDGVRGAGSLPPTTPERDGLKSE